jgi:prevent-host-death family protein
MNTFVVTSRDIQRNYGTVIQQVREKKQAAMLVSQNEPQAVIVPLERYRKLEQMERRAAFERLLQLADEIAEEHKNSSLPSDMSVNHDKYFAEGAEADLERIHKQHDNNC